MVLCSAGKKSTPLWPTPQHQVARVSTFSPSRPAISQPPPLNLVTWEGQGGTGSPDPHQVAGGGESLSSPTRVLAESTRGSLDLCHSSPTKHKERIQRAPPPACCVSGDQVRGLDFYPCLPVATIALILSIRK